MSTLNTAEIISATARPTSYNDHDAVSYWAQHVRDENGAEAGDRLDHFGAAMATYGVYLQRIPLGIISNGYITKADGTPQLFSGALSMYVEIDAGMRGLAGILDYRTGLPIGNQSFIQVFIPLKDKEYADSLIELGFIKNLILRPNVNSSVVRFELVNPNSKLGEQFMERDGVNSLKEIAVVLPVEGKASDISYEDAAKVKRVMTRQVNGTDAYSKFSLGGLKAIFGS